MRIAPATAALLVLSALLIAADNRAAEKEGSVFAITGVWKKDGKPLQFGNAVNVGDKICAEKAGSITISFKEGIASYTCERPGCPTAPSCGRGIAEEDKKAVSGLDRFYTAVLPVIRRDGDRLISAVTGGSDVSEAIVPLKGSQVDLTAMLTDLKPGNYGCRFTPVSPTLGSPGPLVNFEQHEGMPTLVSLEKAAPGLYQVELFDHEAKALGMDAWVLVSGPDTYGDHCESFKQATQMSANWGNNKDERSVRALLRAYLQSLAQRQAGR